MTWLDVFSCSVSRDQKERRCGMSAEASVEPTYSSENRVLPRGLNWRKIAFFFFF